MYVNSVKISADGQHWVTASGQVIHTMGAENGRLDLLLRALRGTEGVADWKLPKF